VVYDVLDELVLVEVTVPETTEEDVGPVVEEEPDDVTVPLIVLLELVGLELEVEEDETEDVLLDELLTATEEELLVVELVVLVDELEALETVDELVLLVAELIEVLLVVGEEVLLVVELVDEVALLLVVEVVDVLDVVDDEELELVVAAAELEELVLVVQTPGEAGTDPHWYTSNLFPAPQNSLGAPPQGILQSDNGAETLPHCNWFPQ
jgi:hypothetical protein